MSGRPRMNTQRKIRKILIANRGEIAVRIIRCCRDMGIESVAVFSDADRRSAHVRLADEARHVGIAAATESYLSIERIVRAARDSGTDAVHPGYGFLAENAEFAEACAEAGLIFIGPSPDTIRALGDKLQARALAKRAGLPLAPAVEQALSDMKSVAKAAGEIGYPVLIKAAAGGGGKGMRIARSESDLFESLEAAQREAKAAFADERVFIEKLIERPRHIEIQIFGDSHGNVAHLFERECSIQRRHQKVIEEAPSSFVTPEMRGRMGEAAVAIGKETDYLGAGTVEFLVDSDRKFYFLEVNTRLQVEHPVTEMVAGIDLAREQIRIAGGEKLSFNQNDLRINGWAIESRIYAEDPANSFLPSTGTLNGYREPAGPGVRVDSGVVLGSVVDVHYDPLLAKLIVHGQTRDEAIARTLRALQEYRITGVNSTVGFAAAAIGSRAFRAGDLSTSFLDDHFPDGVFSEDDSERLELAAITLAALQHRDSEKTLAEVSAQLAGASGWKTRARQRALNGSPLKGWRRGPGRD
ncbi:MAG: acetyl/propionyl/methylcrotonyl-CoA carboxylase subunit alpha [Candidatus Zixiibacteriota bacterium]